MASPWKMQQDTANFFSPNDRRHWWRTWFIYYTFDLVKLMGTNFQFWNLNVLNIPYCYVISTSKLKKPYEGTNYLLRYLLLGKKIKTKKFFVSNFCRLPTHANVCCDWKSYLKAIGTAIVSYKSPLELSVYHSKSVMNHGSFIPLKYSLTCFITKHHFFMIYEVYATHNSFTWTVLWKMVNVFF